MDPIVIWIKALTMNPPASMAQRHRPQTSLPVAQDFETPPPSEPEKLTDDGYHNAQINPEDEDPPLEYRERDFDWFVPGRLFKIFAPRDVEIHKKEFVLLDTKNKEGPGLRICGHRDEEEHTNKGYFLRSHVAVQNYIVPHERQRSRTKTVYLDEYEDREVEKATWIELEHSYNIPFVKYRCVDRGVLDRASLQDLRRCYVEWLQYHWSLA